MLSLIPSAKLGFRVVPLCTAAREWAERARSSRSIGLVETLASKQITLIHYSHRIFDALDSQEHFDVHAIVENMRQDRNIMVQALVCCKHFFGLVA